MDFEMLEMVRLRVAADKADDFVSVTLLASRYLDEATGFRELRLHRCIEEPDLFVLLLSWQRRSDIEGFRLSAAHKPFRALLDGCILEAKIRHFEEAVAIRSTPETTVRRAEGEEERAPAQKQGATEYS